MFSDFPRFRVGQKVKTLYGEGVVISSKWIEESRPLSFFSFIFNHINEDYRLYRVWIKTGNPAKDFEVSIKEKFITEVKEEGQWNT